MEIAVQLFTLRDACARDFPGALERVARIGFRAVELAGMHGMSPAELKKTLDQCHLRPVSAHVGYDSLTGAIDEVVRDARQLGYRFVVCPYINEEQRKDAAAWRQVAKNLNTAGERLRKAELQLCYHHHAFEFEAKDGKRGFDLLAQGAGAEVLNFEIDTYWAHEGGEDPAGLIRSLGARCPLVHAKDRAKDGSFAEVGSGTLDFAAILAAAKAAGARALIVEQDTCPRDPFDCIATSLSFLQQRGLA